MKLQQTTEGDVLVLSPEGSLNATTSSAFDQALEAPSISARRIRSRRRSVHVEHRRPIGGWWRQAAQAARATGAAGLSAQLRSVFALSGFDSVLRHLRAARADEELAALVAG